MDIINKGPVVCSTNNLLQLFDIIFALSAMNMMYASSVSTGVWAFVYYTYW